jgi:hypothetical protein
MDTLIDPTAQALFIKLREFLLGRWNRSGERLLVYYAGHGFTDFNQYSRIDMGYITGSDTPAYKHNWDGSIPYAISFQDIDALNRETRVRHVVMLFDSCFSGSLFSTRASDIDPKHYDYEGARDALQQPVRYYITAGGSTEKIPAISPFADLVARGLRGEADFYKDGFITAEELGQYLQHNMPIYTHQSLRPLKGPIFDTKLDKGEFIFATGLTPVASLPANEALAKGNAANLRSDYGEALRWHRKAADQGNAHAQDNIGASYINGWGVAQDYAEAMRWNRKAADQGNDDAQYGIGWLFELGWGVAQDYAEAMRWYRKAADQGNGLGQLGVGWLYEHGQGVAQDYAEAMRWYRKAADQGNEEAKTRIAALTHS